MSSPELITRFGVLAAAALLLLVLAVVMLRLAALPLAAAVVGLDALAELAARPLALPSSTPAPAGGGPR